jgi:membrane-associated protease RseP (regulator of RpoE activity)
VGHADIQRVDVGGFTTWQGHTLNAAQVAGLKVGDELIAIDGHAVTGDNSAAAIISANADKQITLTVLRAGHRVTLHATPADGRKVLVGGQPAESDGALLVVGRDPSLVLHGGDNDQ